MISSPLTPKPCLTFANGLFLIKDRNSVEPVNLKAAVALRPHADDKAERVFQHVFNRLYDEPQLPPLPHLDPHQKEGVDWILSRKRSYLAHAAGAGKTATVVTAAMLSYEENRPILFIVPPSLIENWYREISKWKESLRHLGNNPWWVVTSVPSTAKKDEMIWHVPCIICPDSMLAKPWVLEKLISRNWGFIAVDEASRFKNIESERAKALFGGVLKTGQPSPGLILKPKHVVLMDGSPMPNRPMELWGPTYALDPEAIDCMGIQDFGFRYCGAQLNNFGQWEFNHSSREPELNDKLTKRFMHVVNEDALNHPERQRSILYTSEDVLSPQYKTWHRAHAQMIDGEFNDSRGDLASARKMIGLDKAPWVAAYVSERMRYKKEQILIFCWHREVAEILNDMMQTYKPGLIIGGTPNETRERILKDFAEGRSRLIIGNIEALGRGHNIQSADRIVFAEFSWTDETNKQAEKRASRRGRAAHLPVRCDYVCAPNSLDQMVLNSLFTKEKRVRKIIK